MTQSPAGKSRQQLVSEAAQAVANSERLAVSDPKSNKYTIACTEVHRIMRLAKSSGFDIDAFSSDVEAMKSSMFST